MGGDWKRVSYHENGIFYSHRCVSCRTISLPSFNVLHCKLAKVTLFIYSIYYWVECMTSSVISFAYFTHCSNLISPELLQIFANGKRRFYSFIEFYIIHSKNQAIKIWSWYHFKVFSVSPWIIMASCPTTNFSAFLLLSIQSSRVYHKSMIHAKSWKGQVVFLHMWVSLWAGSPLSHVRERRRAILR